MLYVHFCFNAQIVSVTKKEKKKFCSVIYLKTGLYFASVIGQFEEKREKKETGAPEKKVPR